MNDAPERTCQQCGKRLETDHKGKCPHCGGEGSTYKVMSITETSSTTSSGMRAKRKDGKEWYREEINRLDESGDPELPSGVRHKRVIDREKDSYDQVVTDNETGKVTHEEHTSLKGHKKK